MKKINKTIKDIIKIILLPDLSLIILPVIFLCFNIGRRSYAESSLFNATRYSYNLLAISILLVVYTIYYGAVYLSLCKEQKDDKNFKILCKMYVRIAITYFLTSISRIQPFASENDFPFFVKLVVFAIPFVYFLFNTIFKFYDNKD